MRRGLALVSVVALAGCGGGGGKPKPPDTKTTAATPQATASPTPTATISPDKIVRWPRYWATRDQAETGADANLDTQLWSGYDENAVVYNGQDVIRVLKPGTGRQIGRVLLPAGRFVCAVPPRREIGSAIAVFRIGKLGAGLDDSTCNQAIGVSTVTGKKRWTYGNPNRNYERSRIDERDGKVLVSDDTGVVVLAAKTGKLLWKRSARRISDGTYKSGSFDCLTASALAADAPVVIALPDDCQQPFTPPKITGLDFATGKVLWRHRDPRDPDAYSPYFSAPDELDGRLLDFFENEDNRKAPPLTVFADSKTGKLTQYAAPLLSKYGAIGGDYDECTDTHNGDGLTRSDETCVLVAGEHAIYFQPDYGKKKDGITVIGTDIRTGKQQWIVRRKYVEAKPGDYTSDFTLMGLNATRTALMIGEQDDTTITSYDANTGKRIGPSGHLGPPLKLPDFAVAGPTFLLVRGAGGITNVKSGLDYYVTGAQ